MLSCTNFCKRMGCPLSDSPIAMKTHTLLFLAASFIALSAGCKPSSSAPSGADTSPPAETIRQLFNSIQKGQLDDAVKLCSEHYVKANGGAETVKSTFAAQTPKIQSQGGVTVDVISVQITGETAVVTFNLHYGNGTIEPCKYLLLKEHGAWKHDGSATS